MFCALLLLSPPFLCCCWSQKLPSYVMCLTLCTSAVGLAFLCCHLVVLMQRLSLCFPTPRCCSLPVKQPDLEEISCGCHSHIPGNSSLHFTKEEDILQRLLKVDNRQNVFTLGVQNVESPKSLRESSRREPVRAWGDDSTGRVNGMQARGLEIRVLGST